MPRIRTIKPQIWGDTKFAQLSIGAKLTFIGLITQADDEGRLEYHPKILKSTLYPLHNVSVDKWVREVDEKGLIQCYSVNGNDYIQVKNWAVHQKISHPIGSQFPEIPEDSRKFWTDKDKDKDKDKDIYRSIFANFWQEYPRKIAKKKAYNCFKQRIKEGVKPEALILAAKNYSVECRIEKREDRFIMHPSTFLSGTSERFSDYLTWEPPEDKICKTCGHREMGACKIDGHSYNEDTPCQTGEWVKKE